MAFEFVIPLLFFAVFFAAIMYFSVMVKGRFSETLKSVALDLGCRHIPGKWLTQPRVEGEYRGRRIMVDAVVEGSGKHSKTYTRIQVWHKGRVSEEMVLEPENIITRIAEMLGAADLKVGNAQFDGKYRVGARNRMEALNILDFEVQHKLLEAKITLHILRDRMYANMRGYVNDRDKIVKLVNALSDVAERVEKV